MLLRFSGYVLVEFLFFWEISTFGQYNQPIFYKQTEDNR